MMPASVCADTFTFGWVDAMAARDKVGSICSADGNVIIECKCGTKQTPSNSSLTQLCARTGETFTWGCRFQGTMAENAQYWCVPFGSALACDVCGCKDVKSDTAWTSIGNSRVSREVQTATSSEYSCSVTTSIEYACNTGSYRSAGSGLSMTCSPCPQQLGSAPSTSKIGNLSITGCYIPAKTSFSDDTGTGTYVHNCYYSEDLSNAELSN